MDTPPGEERVVGIDEIPDQMLLTTMTMEFRFVVPILYRSGAFRSRTLRRYLNGPYVRGLNRLLEHLDEAAKSYSEIEALKPALVLLERAKADCEVAIVCVFSGMTNVAEDQMRDLMEIEYLLKDFRHDLDRLQVWARASSEEERRLFRPAQLRAREANRQRVKPSDLHDSADYQSHSQALHVSKESYRAVPRGIDSTLESTSDLHADIGLWELFWHSRNLLFEISGLFERAGGTGEPPSEDDAYVAAWIAAQKAKTEHLDRVLESVQSGKRGESAGIAKPTIVQGKVDAGSPVKVASVPPMAGESESRRYEIVVLVSCTSSVEGPYLVEFEYEMSMFDDCLVFDHLTPAAELGVQMVVTAPDQWEAMDVAESRVQKALRRLALSNCRTEIVRRQRLT